MKVAMTRAYDGEMEAVRLRLRALEGRLQTKYHCRTEWTDEQRMTLGAPGVRGHIQIDDGALRVELDLSAVLRPLRGRIERELGQELDRVVNACVPTLDTLAS